MQRDNHVCFRCRYVVKSGSKCPHCQQKLFQIGYKWRLPKKSDLKGWKTTLETIRNYNSYYQEMLKDAFVK